MIRLFAAALLFVLLVLAAFLAAALRLVWFLALVRAAFLAAAWRFAREILMLYNPILLQKYDTSHKFLFN